MKHDDKGGINFPLILGSLGVVFGDIGTSPLYALKECFDHKHGLPITPDNIMGISSLIVWALFLVISIKYLLFIMRASNQGEGGILALLALASRRQMYRSQTLIKWVVPAGLFGAALLYGDGIITPAISVLSAVEGIKIATPVFEAYIIPLTIVIMTILFWFQKWGTAKIGTVFGPIMLVWFSVIGGLGLLSILENPGILMALNPLFAVEFFATNGFLGFLILGSVFLVVTGGEALYADMGHFGRGPIRTAWTFVVLPGLILNYLGQGALLLRDPSAIESPFYRMSPGWALIPMVILATMATVIASQALISGVYSLTRQAIQLGYLPRMQIVHTSSEEIGQIYIPLINWTLYVCVIWLVFEFKSSTAMAAAYGVAVTTTMVITTFLAYFVATRKWGWSKTLSAFVVAPFLAIDFAFFSSNLFKISDGGWFPLAVGAVFFLLMTTWRKGRYILAQKMRQLSEPTDQFLEHIRRDKPVRVQGTAFFMTSDPEGVPPALLHNMKHNRVLHEKVVLLTIQTKDVPNVPPQERLEVSSKGENIHRLIARYGFMESPNITEILKQCEIKGVKIEPKDITFFLGRETILPSAEPGMAIWREHIFSLMSKNAERATSFFKIPPDQVIEVGLQIEI